MNSELAKSLLPSYKNCNAYVLVENLSYLQRKISTNQDWTNFQEPEPAISCVFSLVLLPLVVRCRWLWYPIHWLQLTSVSIHYQASWSRKTLFALVSKSVVFRFADGEVGGTPQPLCLAGGFFHPVLLEEIQAEYEQEKEPGSHKHPSRLARRFAVGSFPSLCYRHPPHVPNHYHHYHSFPWLSPPPSVESVLFRSRDLCRSYEFL